MTQPTAADSLVVLSEGTSVDVPLVTIGLPVYNCEETVEDAIRSVYLQTYPNWELIIIDDGSNDRTPEILKGLDHDERVKVVARDGQNVGLAARLNQIAKMANGDFIARFDADDLMHPERIERQMAYMLTHPTVDVVGTGVYVIDRSNQVIGIRRGKKVEHSVRAALRHSPLMHPTILARNAWVTKHPYDQNIRRAQDRELWCRTIEQSQFSNLSDPLYFYREVGTRTPRQYFDVYLRNRDTRLFLVNKYGKEALSLIGRLLMYTSIVGKAEVYRVMAMFRMHASQFVRRRESITAEDRAQARSVIKTITGL